MPAIVCYCGLLHGVRDLPGGPDCRRALCAPRAACMSRVCSAGHQHELSRAAELGRACAHVGRKALNTLAS
eukprot:scaffold19934_cov169-Isochrysis_galbana.AAC.1